MGNTRSLEIRTSDSETAMGGTSFAEKPELIYFPCFGRAGVTKLMFRLGNVAFTDSIVAWETWETRKNGKHSGIIVKLIRNFRVSDGPGAGHENRRGGFLPTESD